MIELSTGGIKTTDFLVIEQRIYCFLVFSNKNPYRSSYNKYDYISIDLP